MRGLETRMGVPTRTYILTRDSKEEKRFSGLQSCVRRQCSWCMISNIWDRIFYITSTRTLDLYI